MARLTVHLFLLCCFFVTACTNFSPQQDVRPTDQGEVIPNWVRLNPDGIRIAVSQDSVDISTPDDSNPGVICSNACTQDLVVTVLEARTDDIIEALQTTHQLSGTHKADIFPSAAGLFEDTSFLGVSGAYPVSIVLALSEQTELETISLSPTDLSELRVFIFMPGDANLDGAYNEADWDLILPKYEKRIPATWNEGDFNQDGFVDSTDMIVSVANWLKVIPFWPNY